MEPLWHGRSGRRDTPPTVGLGSVSAGTPVVSPISGPAMEIAHILFMDIVGYSKLRTIQQADVQRELQHQLQIAGEVTLGRQEGKLIIRPTGDGAALLFLRDLLSPLRCAIQVQTLLRHNEAEIRARTGTTILLRMGVHSGPIIVTQDLNSQSDVAGEGINMTQRIMDCGDAGHILLSAEYASKLRAIDPWPRYLQDIGEYQVKHGQTIHLYNFYGKFDGIPCGLPSRPTRLVVNENAASTRRNERRGVRIPLAWKPWIIGICLSSIVGGFGYNLWNTNPNVRKQAAHLWAEISNPGGTPASEAARQHKRTASNTGRNRKPSRPASDNRSVQASVTPAIETVAPVENVTVPSFLGLTLADAEKLAQDRGLRVRRSVNSGYSLDYGEGLIYQQSESAGSLLRMGKAIYVRVSKGEPPESGAPSDPETSKTDSAKDDANKTPE